MSIDAGRRSSSGAPKGPFFCLQSWQKRGMVPRSWGHIMDMRHTVRTGNCTKGGKKGKNQPKKVSNAKYSYSPQWGGFQPRKQDHC